MKNDVVSYSDGSFTDDDIAFTYFGVNYGFKDKNPVDAVKFYRKGDLSSFCIYEESFKVEKEQVSLLLPSKFAEKYFRIYTKDKSKLVAVKAAFKKYCQKELGLTTGMLEGINLSTSQNSVKKTKKDFIDDDFPQKHRHLN